MGAAVGSEPDPAAALAQPCADADPIDRIATRLYKGAHRIGGFGLAEQNAMHPTRQDLAKLPGVKAHNIAADAFHRRFHNHRGHAMARARRPAIHQAAHIVIQPGHIKRAMLHAHVYIVGPGGGVGLALFIGEHMAGVPADVVDGLILRQQFDGAVYS